jgi:hypothetical protein
MKHFIIFVFFLLFCVIAYLVFTFSPRQFTLKDIEPVAEMSSENEEPSSVKLITTEASMLPETLTSADQDKPSAGKISSETKTIPAPGENKTAKNAPATKAAKVPDAAVKSANSEVGIYKYYVIIEGFKNLNAARERAANLEKKFNTEMVVLPPTPAGIYRISYGQYDTYEMAEKALVWIKIKIRPEAWIFSVKK